MSLFGDISDTVSRSTTKTSDSISKSYDSITSATTLDLFNDLQVDKEDTGEYTLPKLPKRSNSQLNKEPDREELLTSSSDAPLFSSDDLPASSAENYLEHRHKRQHRRQWYEEENASNAIMKSSPVRTPRSRGPFKRNLDSAVWLGSDDSTENEEDERNEAIRKTLRVMGRGGSIDSDEEDEFDLGDEFQDRPPTPEEVRQAALLTKAMQTTEDPGSYEGPIFPYWQRQPDRLEDFHAAQKVAQMRVLDCVERGAENLDLSTLHLQQVRTPTLRPLRYYTKITPRQRRANRYHRLTPALRLFLSNNLLEDVPGEVYHLKNLEVLSLRSNNLTEILPSIGELTNLKELNLGSNQLGWLPWEMLSLVQSSLKKCMIYPNPFIRPVPSIWNYDPLGSLQSGEPCKVASTRTAFLDITGDSYRQWPPSPSSLPEHWPERQEEGEFLGPLPNERSKTPSLHELALRACYKSPHLSQLPFMLPDDTPPHITRLLQTTWKLKEAGGKTCSVCGQEYIIPRTEWVEWWYCIPWTGIQNERIEAMAKDRGPVPLLRRGCSWACWEENAAPLIRGWSSSPVPGAHKAFEWSGGEAAVFQGMR